MRTVVIAFAAFFLGCVATAQIGRAAVVSQSMYIHDESRNRDIPIEIYYREAEEPHHKEPVLLSAGYGCSATEYSYIAKALSEKGYLVVALQHELETDAELPSGENVYELRLPNWREGIKSIQAVVAFLHTQYPALDCTALHLIGHSNGGDISMLFATQYPAVVRSCITLDHRRVPIPKRATPPVLSIRASEFAADEGVLPNSADAAAYGIKIVTLQNVGHNYLRDNATKETKELIIQAMTAFLP